MITQPNDQEHPRLTIFNHKMLLNKNESYLVLVAKQILLVTINNVYWYKTRNNISLSIHCARFASVTHYFRVEINMFGS